jgi:hypothetical protein
MQTHFRVEKVSPQETLFLVKLSRNLHMSLVAMVH